MPVDYEEQTELADARYPFLLNTGRILYQYHSSTLSLRCPSLRAFAKASYVLVNPADADRLGLSEGERVRLSSRRGELETELRIDPGVSAGELFMPFHFPDALVNRLTRDELDPSSKIAPFKLSACALERATVGPFTKSRARGYIRPTLFRWETPQRAAPARRIRRLENPDSSRRTP